RARVEMRGLDLPYRPPRRHTGDVLRHVDPRAAAILRVPDLAVVRAGPDQAALDCGRRNREDHLAVELAQVVPDDAAGRDDPRGIAGGEVGADHGPALPAVGRFGDHLAAIVDRVVIERVDRPGGCAVAAV